MSVFGRIGEANLWSGRIFRRTKKGLVVQDGRDTAFLRHDRSRVYDGRISDRALWSNWHQGLTRESPRPPVFFLPPEVETLERPRKPWRAEPRTDYRPPELTPAVLYQSGIVADLGVKEDGVDVFVWIQGDVNVKVTGVDVFTGGTQWVTVTQSES